MILLGRLARYQAHIQQLENFWDCTLDDLRIRYESQGNEDFEVDDAYLEWQWHDEAIDIVKAQLQVISNAPFVQPV
jgi:hypothetical protein